MLRKIRERIQSEEKGFTLIELLVVVLIIGILAAIALPAFLGQRQKGQDASAKSNARNIVSHVESCFASEQTYANCGNTANDITSSDIPVGTGAGQVNITPDGTNGYTVAAKSESGNTFTIKKSGANVDRTCVTVNKGACPSTGKW